MHTLPLQLSCADIHPPAGTHARTATRDGQAGVVARAQPGHVPALRTEEGYPILGAVSENLCSAPSVAAFCVYAHEFELALGSIDRECIIVVVAEVHSNDHRVQVYTRLTRYNHAFSV